MKYYYIQISDHGKNTYTYYQSLLEMTTAASFLKYQNKNADVKCFVENIETNEKMEVK